MTKTEVIARVMAGPVWPLLVRSTNSKPGQGWRMEIYQYHDVQLFKRVAPHGLDYEVTADYSPDEV